MARQASRLSHMSACVAGNQRSSSSVVQQASSLLFTTACDAGNQRKTDHCLVQQASCFRHTTASDADSHLPAQQQALLAEVKGVRSPEALPAQPLRKAPAKGRLPLPTRWRCCSQLGQGCKHELSLAQYLQQTRCLNAISGRLSPSQRVNTACDGWLAKEEAAPADEQLQGSPACT